MRFYLIAGPNGAGKSTFAAEYLSDNCEFINADIIAAELSPSEPDRAALQAARVMLERIDALAAARQSIAIETTLSGRRYAHTFSRLKKQGYTIELHYLWLPSAEVSVARVQSRVAHGGHNIPPTTIRRRYKAGLANFFTLYATLADSWTLIDNSGLDRREIARSRSQALAVTDPDRYRKLTREFAHARTRER